MINTKAASDSDAFCQEQSKNASVTAICHQQEIEKGAACRFMFHLSPGQEQLALTAPFTLKPASGVFVMPELRA